MRGRPSNIPLIRADERTFVDTYAPELIHHLPTKQQEALKLRFGLDGAPPKTFSSIAQELGITAEEARQLTNRAKTALAKRANIALLPEAS